MTFSIILIHFVCLFATSLSVYRKRFVKFIFTSLSLPKKSCFMEKNYIIPRKIFKLEILPRDARLVFVTFMFAWCNEVLRNGSLLNIATVGLS